MAVKQAPSLSIAEREQLRYDLINFTSKAPTDRPPRYLGRHIRIWPDSMTSKWFALVEGQTEAVGANGRTPEAALVAIAKALRAAVG